MPRLVRKSRANVPVRSPDRGLISRLAGFAGVYQFHTFALPMRAYTAQARRLLSLRLDGSSSRLDVELQTRTLGRLGPKH